MLIDSETDEEFSIEFSGIASLMSESADDSQTESQCYFTLYDIEGFSRKVVINLDQDYPIILILDGETEVPIDNV